MTLAIGTADAARVKRAIAQHDKAKKRGEGGNYAAAPDSGPADQACRNCASIRRISHGHHAAKCNRYMPNKPPTTPADITIDPESPACFYFTKLATDSES